MSVRKPARSTLSLINKLKCSGKITRSRNPKIGKRIIPIKLESLALDNTRALAAFDDVLDERLARDEVERLARKPGRGEACGDDAKDAHGRDLRDHSGECTA